MIPYFEKNYMQEHNLSFIDKENDLNFIKKFVKINSGHEKFYDIKIISDENGEDIVTFIGYDFSSNTNSIYWFGEENKNIEIFLDLKENEVMFWEICLNTYRFYEVKQKKTKNIFNLENIDTNFFDEESRNWYIDEDNLKLKYKKEFEEWEKK